MDMMNVSWILVVAVAALLGTLSGFLDNYTADVIFKGKFAQAEKMVFGPLYTICGVIILLIFQPSFPDIWPVLILAASGIISSLGSIPYFAGLEREETTAAIIFAQLIPVFNLALAWAFLGQQISGMQLVAFGVMMAAPLIVIASQERRSKKTGIVAALCFTIYGLISAASGLFFVDGSQKLGGDNFLVALAIMLIGKGCTDMILMGAKKNWRHHFYRQLKKEKFKLFAVTGANFFVWEGADLLYRLAIVSAEAVALASVSYEAIELILTFFLGVVFSLLWPSFGREKLKRKTVMAHLAATVVALIGIVLLG